MADGTPQPDPNNPDYKKAYDDAYKIGTQDNKGGLFGIFETIADMAMAAEAGAFAVRPDVAQEVVKQLSRIQDQVIEIRSFSSTFGLRPELGGGYATQVATFNTQVTNEGPGKLLDNFAQEIEQLKAAVTKSIANYASSDGDNRQRVNRAGEGK
ncbi:hypothetical protein LWC34_41055 [Kibdelosporangium philippinense]|uniref:Uncharacterized protein n=1 Tax=Kibdelosporangium philippinense TaxID=211113 RepID=A0ABS8ZQG5_9PSEU|nr:hypothetical protein [Kibdelosporangium philippinense]MCE7009160.1 hypothetical protein [Kibdelosporangium philippinense]